MGYFHPSKTGVSIVDILHSRLQYDIVVLIVFPASLGIRVCVTIIVQVLDARAWETCTLQVNPRGRDCHTPHPPPPPVPFIQQQSIIPTQCAYRWWIILAYMA